MKIAVAVPRVLAERKPKHGEPCNRCGLCCYMTLCPLGEKLFGREIGPCPALRLSVGESACDVVLHPLRYAGGDAKSLSDTALLMIGSNTGCDCRVNGEPINAAFNAELERLDIVNAGRAEKARKLWSMED